MAVVTDTRSVLREILPSALRSLLGASLSSELEAFVRSGARIYEIRLRAGRCASVVCDTGNVALRYVATYAEVSDILAQLCEYSLYAYADTINRGYVTIDGGIRVGVVGRAVMSGETVSGVYDISSLCFRLPRRVDGIGERICKLIRDSGGALVYSPPGVGKTTLLRCVAERIADFGADGGAMRVAVVDTRGELGVYLGERSLCVDVLSGYSRESGIEIAARSLNAELVVCDELYGDCDVRAVIQARNCGVCVLATAHAHTLAALFRRDDMRSLHKACAFENYVGISRRASGGDFEYDIVSWEEAEKNYA